MRAMASATLDGSSMITRGDSTLTGTRSRTLSLSTQRATQSLLEDLDRAKEELATVQRECEELRMLVRGAEPEELSGVSLPIQNFIEPDTQDVHESAETESEAEHTRVVEGDEIDRMSEAQAKQKLRVCHFSLFFAFC